MRQLTLADPIVSAIRQMTARDPVRVAKRRRTEGAATNSTEPHRRLRSGSICRQLCQLALLAPLAMPSLRAASNPPTEGSPQWAKPASFPITVLPTAHVFIENVMPEPPEQRGLVWLDNRRVMFVGFVPENRASRGPRAIHIWDVVANTVTQYSTHERFCYNEGYILTFDRSQRLGTPDAPRSWTPLRYGLLGQEKDDVCDTLTGRGCPRWLNKSCKPVEIPPDSSPLGKDSGVFLQLRSGDGALVAKVGTEGKGSPKTDEERKNLYSRPMWLFSKHHPQGRVLPFLFSEAIGATRAIYSVFGARYVFIPGRPIDDPLTSSTGWPDGRPQPVYLMNSDGNVQTIHVPSRRDWNTVLLAMPAVPGLVFSGHGGVRKAGGGVFLYDERDVWRLDRGFTSTIAVSPDGCKLAYAIINDYGQTSNAALFTIKSIRFCKRGE